MSTPRAVVIPFGVPDDGRGLGLGLAALLHVFAQIDGESVALAQLHTRRKQQSGDRVSTPGGEEAPVPVEAFVPPNAWRDIAGTAGAPMEVTLVVTGAFEPPGEGRGMIQLLVFDAASGATRAKVEAHLDEAHAGATVLAAFDELWRGVGGELGGVRDIGDLDWDALHSVLLAERCALHDPLRGGPHDRLAAIVHFGRAIGDAPDGRFATGRLASIAMETALAQPRDPRVAQVALRALARAAEDAPARFELVDAIAALEVRFGQARSAERRMNAALAVAPKEVRAYARLAEALRARGDIDGAVTALQAGLAELPGDPLLLTERGVALAEREDLVGAATAWRSVLVRDPVHPAAFANLAALAMRQKDGVTAQALVDAALATTRAHPEVWRRAIQLALASEADGIARSARVARLARSLLAAAPDDAWGALALARAQTQLGETDAAREQLLTAERLAPDTALAAEARRARFALDEPEGALEVEAVMRAANGAKMADLADVATRARRLATMHGAWVAWVATAIAERRIGRWDAAADAAESAIAAAPGCTPAHAELVTVRLALGDARAAMHHAERAAQLEGETSRTLSLLARSLHGLGRRDEARAAIDRALALDPTDDALQHLAERIRAGKDPERTVLDRFRAFFRRK